MIVSRNEVETTTHRAALGVGLPHGLAEDAAAIGGTLVALRPDGLAILLGALRYAEAHPVAGPPFRRAGDRWRASRPGLPSLIAGPMAADLRGAFPAMTIDAGGTDAPAIMEICLGGRPQARDPDGIAVTDGDWAALQALAARTYVPASETSRMTGAGAGLRDDD